MSVSGFSPRSPTSPAVVTCAFLEGATTPRFFSLFFPANARSLISMSSNSDSWIGFPQTESLVTCDSLSFPYRLMRS